jgi:hypothetical protein
LTVDPLECIAKASKIKAEINVIISAFGVKGDDLDDLIERKLVKAREIIGEETEAGRFPILGYSYYEYSNSLVDSDKSSSLLYSEYALELSNLDIYFQDKSNGSVVHTVTQRLDLFSNHLNLLLFILCVMFVSFFLGVKVTQYHFEKKLRIITAKAFRSVEKDGGRLSLPISIAEQNRNMQKNINLSKTGSFKQKKSKSK